MPIAGESFLPLAHLEALLSLGNFAYIIVMSGRSRQGARLQDA
jgi:hypothetical protein